MLRNNVDFEVVDLTIKFISEMYEKHGKQISPTLDYRSIAYLGICNAVKEYSQDLHWTHHNYDGDIQLSDITFNQSVPN